MPLLNDNFYPTVKPQGGSDFAKPLKLLAKSIAFIDPITQQTRRFDSQLHLIKNSNWLIYLIFIISLSCWLASLTSFAPKLQKRPPHRQSTPPVDVSAACSACCKAGRVVWLIPPMATIGSVTDCRICVKARYGNCLRILFGGCGKHRANAQIICAVCLRLDGLLGSARKLPLMILSLPKICRTTPHGKITLTDMPHLP